ncbi:unnamed protein product [Menidia menidia]|uniref:(Atlantic silverside) hypothetical protein n=1 Tax=Menidia menidia TaxID=238744 RepID=A0A8S4B3C0_9TELE|nr:unnamed protein product [Menidia menidia]
MGSCTEARTEGVAAASSGTGMEAETSVKYTLISALAALALVLGLAVVVGTIICLRKRRKDNAGMELELGPADADPMELDELDTFCLSVKYQVKVLLLKVCDLFSQSLPSDEVITVRQAGGALGAVLQLCSIRLETPSSRAPGP